MNWGRKDDAEESVLLLKQAWERAGRLQGEKDELKELSRRRNMG